MPLRSTANKSTLERLNSKRDTRNLVKELAADAFSGHTLTEESPSLWRCGRPDTGIYAFRVAELPGLIVVWGDLGVLAIDQGHGYNLSWLESAIQSRNYVLEKSSTAKRDTYYPGDFKTYVEESLVEDAEDADFESRQLMARMGNFDEEALENYIAETGNIDLRDYVYSWGATEHWLCEALEKFFELRKKSTASL